MTNKDIEHDLLKIIDKLDELDQKVINLNYKLNQHIKEGHIPNGQNISDTGVSTIFTGVRDNSPDPV
jgi:DNA-directed RNA polymerase specialized sigma subunit